MDYNINFKYQSGGKTGGALGVAGINRQKAIQASKGATGTLKPDDASRKLIDSNVKLTNSILKLTQVVSKLSSPGGGGGGSGSGHPGRNTFMGSFAGSAMGTSVGSVTDIVGWTVQKINQIGNSYIEKTSQQAKSVGVGGFRRGMGMYDAAEMGAGMKAYGMASGKFADERHWTGKYEKDDKGRFVRDEKGNKIKKTAFNVQANEDAIQMGNIYGLSAEQTLGQAGTFKRTGANYSNAVNMGAGVGLESELPAFISALSSTLEEAVKSGLDTSEMRKDMSSSLLSMVKATPGGSVEGAMRIARSGAVTKASGASGQVTDVKGILGWKYGQQKAIESINRPADKKTGTPSGLQELLEEGIIDYNQYKSLSQKRGSLTEADLYKGGVNFSFLTQKAIEKSSDQDLAQGIYKGGLNTFKGMDTGVMSQIMGYLPSENAVLHGAVTDPVIENKKTIAKGKSKLGKKSAAVTGSVAGYGVELNRMKENTLLNEGKPFAEAAIAMEKVLLKLATNAAPMAVDALKLLGVAAKTVAGEISGAKNIIGKFDKLSKTGKAKFFLDSALNSITATQKLANGLYDKE